MAPLYWGYRSLKLLGEGVDSILVPFSIANFGQNPEIVQAYWVRKAIVRSDGLILGWPDNYQEARKLGSELWVREPLSKSGQCSIELVAGDNGPIPYGPRVRLVCCFQKCYPDGVNFNGQEV